MLGQIANDFADDGGRFRRTNVEAGDETIRIHVLSNPRIPIGGAKHRSEEPSLNACDDLISVPQIQLYGAHTAARQVLLHQLDILKLLQRNVTRGPYGKGVEHDVQFVERP